MLSVKGISKRKLCYLELTIILSGISIDRAPANFDANEMQSVVALGEIVIQNKRQICIKSMNLNNILKDRCFFYFFLWQKGAGLILICSHKDEKMLFSNG